MRVPYPKNNANQWTAFILFVIGGALMGGPPLAVMCMGGWLTVAVAVDEITAAINKSKEGPPCVFEAVTEDGTMHGAARARCQVHGFDCPQLVPKST